MKSYETAAAENLLTFMGALSKQWDPAEPSIELASGYAELVRTLVELERWQEEHD